jgi:hypothetical protein
MRRGEIALRTSKRKWKKYFYSLIFRNQGVKRLWWMGAQSAALGS